MKLKIGDYGIWNSGLYGDRTVPRIIIFKVYKINKGFNGKYYWHIVRALYDNDFYYPRDDVHLDGRDITKIDDFNIEQIKDYIMVELL